MASRNEAQIKVSVFNQEFNKGMKEMSSESAKLKREFQLQQEQMKHTASETEKLSATVEYLQKQQELAGRRVAETQRQYEAVKAQYGENSRAAQEMAARLDRARIEEQRFANQVIETNQSIEQQAEQVESTADRMSNFGGKMNEIGQTLSAGLTLPLTGIGTLALKTADDFDAVGDRLQTQLGLTAKKAEELEEVAANLWRNAFGENLQETTDAVATVYQQLGNLPVGELEAVAESAFMIAEAFGGDIKETTRAAGQLMQQFGVDSTKAMDLITVAFQRGGDYSDELLDSISEYSTQFANMGYTAEQMVGMFASGVESGIFSLDKLGDTVKESFLQITDGADNTRSSLSELGLDFKQIEGDLAAGGDQANAAFMAVMTAIAGVSDEADRNRLAIELMGTPLEDLGPQYQAFFATASEGMTDFEGAAQKASDSMKDNLGAELTSTLRELQEAVMPLGETLLEIIQTALPYIREFAITFANLSPTIHMVILALGGFLALIGPLLMMVGMFLQGIGSIVGPIGMLIKKVRESAAIMTFLRTALATLSGPIGIISALVIGLAIVIYKNWDTIKAKTIEIWTTTMEWLRNAWESIKSFSSETWTAIKESITNIWNSFVAFLTNTWTTIKDGMAAAWEAIKTGISVAWMAIVTTVQAILAPFVQGILDFFNNMKNGVSQIFEGLKLYFTSVWDFIKNLFLGSLLLLLDLVTGDFESMKVHATQIFQNLSQALLGIWNGLKLIFSGALEAIKGLVSTAWDHLKTNTLTIFNSVKGFLANTWQSIKTTVQTIIINLISAAISRFENLRASISEKMNAARAKVSEIWNAIKTNSTNLPETIKNTVRAKFEALKNAVQEKMNAVKTKIEEIWNKAKSFLTDIDLSQVGKDIIQGLINGIGSMIGAVREKVREVANSVKSKIEEILDINSPSRVTTVLGEFTGEGLGNGILKMKKFVQNAAEQLARWATPDLDLESAAIPKQDISYNLSSQIGEIKAIQDAFRSSLDFLNNQRENGDVYIDGRKAGKILRTHLISENERYEENIGILRG
ncbi:phage tail tape measure protein [Cytobacillus oceanisediminis]|uniref:phage tail tape measure protein n=1 Tax=Cytobacillus oceanisediminis TaxID=665099 RepID=UPI001FB5297D|nr:phage tail tape measure protein [Cytobacillus oceanisediminis]UOE54917.1 phage tail tape measure protein [Cytobacillus oceanisediminis]